MFPSTLFPGSGVLPRAGRTEDRGWEVLLPRLVSGLVALLRVVWITPGGLQTKSL